MTKDGNHGQSGLFDDIADHWDADVVADIDKRIERVVSFPGSQGVSQFWMSEQAWVF